MKADMISKIEKIAPAVNWIIITMILIGGLMLANHYYRPDLYINDRGEWYVHRAEIFNELGDRQNTIHSLLKAREYGSNESIILVQLFLKIKNFDEVKERLKLLEQDHPEEYILFMGRLHMAQCQPEEAITYFAQGINMIPRYPVFYLQYGLAEMLIGNIEEAQENFELALDLTKDVTEQGYTRYEGERTDAEIYAALWKIHDLEGNTKKSDMYQRKAKAIEVQSLLWIDEIVKVCG